MLLVAPRKNVNHSTFAYVVNLSTKGGGRVKNPQNSVNVVYGCPLTGLAFMDRELFDNSTRIKDRFGISGNKLYFFLVYSLLLLKMNTRILFNLSHVRNMAR